MATPSSNGSNGSSNVTGSRLVFRAVQDVLTAPRYNFMLWRPSEGEGKSVAPSLGAAGGPVSVARAQLRATPESPLTKLVIGGVVTCVFELGIGHSLEFLKIAKQTSTESYAQILRKITASKGVIGVLDGFFPWGAIQAMVKGAVFSWGHALAKRTLHNQQLFHCPESTAEVIAGGVGGAVQGFALSPILLLKTRVMTDPRFRSSGGLISTSIASCKVGFGVIRNEGPLALMKGSIVFSSKRVADWTTRYFFSEVLENMMKGPENRQLSLAEKSYASLGGGVISTLVTIPMDVMVATFQQNAKAGQKVSIMDTFREQMRKGGVSGLLGFSTRGFVARVTHVALTTLMMKTMTSFIYDLYFRKASKDQKNN